MHFQAQFNKPNFEPFDLSHSHTHFQLVEIKTRIGGNSTYARFFLSCSDKGHTEKTLLNFLDSNYGIDDSYEGLGEDEHWLEFQEAAISIYNIDADGIKTASAPIYSIDDPELQNLKCYCNDQFRYSI